MWYVIGLEVNAELAEFPSLAINVYDTVTQSRAEYCEPSVMVEKNGVKSVLSEQWWIVILLFYRIKCKAYILKSVVRLRALSKRKRTALQSGAILKNREEAIAMLEGLNAYNKE